jgi:hypothetical protein
MSCWVYDWREKINTELYILSYGIQTPPCKARASFIWIYTIGFELVVKPPTRHTIFKFQKYPKYNQENTNQGTVNQAKLPPSHVRWSIHAPIALQVSIEVRRKYILVCYFGQTTVARNTEHFFPTVQHYYELGLNKLKMLSRVFKRWIFLLNTYTNSLYIFLEIKLPYEKLYPLQNVISS